MSLIGLWVLLSYPYVVPTWYSLSIHAQTTPLLPSGSPLETAPYVLHLYLRQDPVTGLPEWVSGHRMALAFYLEQLPVRLLVLHLPAALVEPNWQESLEKWLLEELSPFLTPYELPYVALGEGWNKVPFSWANLVEKLKQTTPRKWGFYARLPSEIPEVVVWDFFCAAPASSEELSLWKENTHFLFLNESLTPEVPSGLMPVGLIACIRPAPYALSLDSAK
ncbi:MAG: hypothetical protein NZ580_07580 [Bacteroidia bacterium]|nr:hypothetical protein [Bacteroidia bacterium]MDW8236675.1 hypothetical protein [Bacteroidia bacterium]